MFDLLQEISQSLRRNKFRTAMTGFAVVWGIFILVVLLGVSNGLENGMQANYGSRLTNSVDIWTRWTSMPYRGFPMWRNVHFTDREAHIIRNLPEVEYFSRVATAYPNIAFRTESAAMEIKGVEPDFQTIFKKDIICGRFLNSRDEQEHAKVAVIDQRAVEIFATTPEDIVGQYISVGDSTAAILFRVIGVCENGDRWDGATVHIPFLTHRMLYSTSHKFDKMCVTMKPGTRGTEDKVRALLCGPMQFHPDDKQAVGVWSQEESMDQQAGVMTAIRLFIIILGLCTLISGAVGVSNIMLVSVRERTKELGIRKALGAPPASVIYSVVGEALAITVLFGFIGVLLGMGVVALIGMASAGTDVLKEPSVNLSVVLIATAFVVAIGVIAGAIPAVRAMRIKPIEAMRDK